MRFDSLSVNGRARLLSEARILSRLNHPNICAVHDFVSGETTDFLVLELIHGTTLREAITRGIAPGAALQPRDRAPVGPLLPTHSPRERLSRMAARDQLAFVGVILPASSRGKRNG